MTNRLEIYKCEVCGNIVEMLHEGAGQLVCCGAPMKLFKENTVDAAKEKHIPVITRTADGFKVDVGAATFNVKANQLTAREYCNLKMLATALRCFPTQNTILKIRRRGLRINRMCN